MCLCCSGLSRVLRTAVEGGFDAAAAIAQEMIAPESSDRTSDRASRHGREHADRPPSTRYDEGSRASGSSHLRPTLPGRSSSSRSTALEYNERLGAVQPSRDGTEMTRSLAVDGGEATYTARDEGAQRWDESINKDVIDWDLVACPQGTKCPDSIMTYNRAGEETWEDTTGYQPEKSYETD